jgi:hypothetical protein
MAFVPAAPVQYSIKRGSTSRSIFMYLQAASGLPATGIAFDTASVLWSYAGTKLARVAITPADLAAITTAWASGGFKEVDATNMPGVYRLDVPNAALALEVPEVVVTIIKDAVVAGVAIIQLQGEDLDSLSAAIEPDPQDVTTTRTDN